MRIIYINLVFWLCLSPLVAGQDMEKLPDNNREMKSLISGLHTLSIHVQNHATHDSVFRFLTKILELPVYYNPLVIGERRYGGVFAGNLVLEPCGPYSDMVYASKDFKALFFGLTFEPILPISDAAELLREREIEFEKGGNEFIFVTDQMMRRDNIYISLMEKEDKATDQIRLDSLQKLVENGHSGLGIEHIRNIQLGVRDEQYLSKWKSFVAPDTLNEDLEWKIDEKLHCGFTIAPYNQVISITFQVKSLQEAERYLTEKGVQFKLEDDFIRINPAQSFGLLILLQ